MNDAWAPGMREGAVAVPARILSSSEFGDGQTSAAPSFELPQGRTVAFTFIKVDGAGNVSWSSGADRTLSVSTSAGGFTEPELNRRPVVNFIRRR